MQKGDLVGRGGIRDHRHYRPGVKKDEILTYLTYYHFTNFIATSVLITMVDLSLDAVAKMWQPNVRVWTKDYLYGVLEFWNF